MAASLLVSAGSISLVDGTTYFLPIAGGLSATNLTEAQAKVRFKEAGVLSKLSVNVSSNTCSVTSPVTIRQNGSDSSLAVSYGSDETGAKSDLTHTVSVSVDDEVCVSVAIPSEAGTNTMVLRSITLVFTPSNAGETVSLIGTAASSVAHSVNSSLRRLVMAGPAVDVGTNEVNVKWTVRGTFTIRNLVVNVASNSRITDCVFASRKNGSTGNLSVTYAAGETGIKADTTNSDTVAAGDEYVFTCLTSTGGGTITISSVIAHCISSAGDFVLLLADAGAEAVAFNTTTYASVGGSVNSSFSTTEADVQVPARLAFTARELTLSGSSSIATSPSTVTLRVAGGDSALALSFNNGDAVVSDSTHTAAVADGDALAIKAATPNTSGSLTFRLLSMIGGAAAGASGGAGVQDALLESCLLGGRLVQ